MASKLTLNLLKPQDFFNAYYWQSAVKNEDEFSSIVAEYLQNLEKNKHQSEKSICANALKPFFERLNFNVNSEYVLQGVATNSAIDLALIKDENASVIIEVKKQDNKEMITRDNANKKALHEAILYYFRERENGNLSLRFIIISNFYDFYIFRANEIEQIFYKNKQLSKLYRKVVIEKDTLFKGTTKEFYDEAEKIINSDKFINDLINKRQYKEVIDNKGEITSDIKGELFDENGNPITAQINCFHINLAEFKAKSRKAKETVKLFSREFLYGEFSYDPNKISKKFYEELLYILGLTEDKNGNLTPNNVSGSLFKNIESSLNNAPFDTIMQLIILWLNRLLFLKLIETNLINFNANGDKALSSSLKFLNHKIKDFDTLNSVFFDILAKPLDDPYRQQSPFAYLPYLNSNIFQKQQIESNILSINQLHNEQYIEYYPQTTLLDDNRKKRTGTIKFLDYLFQFLDAFDFGETVKDEVSGSTTHSDLISSAVLGQVFEKLNGYKDGSFYTPSFITEYMSKQSIDNLVLQRFSQKLGGQFSNIDDLADELHTQIRQSADKQTKLNEFNAEIDNLKICDPAVGSGYFLVSVLNYLIALKSKLGILIDENGKRLDAEIAYEFDELVIKNYDGSRFHYTRPKAESEPQHIIQKALFNEKAHIIENCLFGVDINPNSCEIARLRLWIELLKSAYFTDFTISDPTKQNALETLPNIDINIKCGNSLVSYFAVNKDIQISDKQAVQQLKDCVKNYKTGTGDKTILLKQIKGLQEKFRNTAFRSNNKIKNLQKQCEIYSQKYSDYLAEDNDKLRPYIHKQFFVEDFNEEDAQKDFNQLLKLHDEIFNLDQFTPFEWRFEFSEVLDENGNFTGFDLIIANPPYISAPSQMENDFLSSQRQTIVYSKRYDTLFQKWDLYIPFIELGINTLCKENGICAMIVPYPFTNQNYATKSRQMLLQKFDLFELCDLQGLKVFDAAVVTNCILFTKKQKSQEEKINISKPNIQDKNVSISTKFTKTYQQIIQDEKSFIYNTEQQNNTKKHSNFNVLGDFCYISVGMVLNADEKTAKGEFTKTDLISLTQDEIHSKPYIDAKDIEKYRVKRIKYLEYNTDRVPNKLRRPTFRELYETRKLMFNRLGTLQVFFDEKGELATSDAMFMGLLWKDLQHVENKSIKNSIKKFSNFQRDEMEQLSQDMDLFYLLGILNSKYASILLENNRGGDYHIYPEHIRNIPIPQITETNQSIANKIIDFVQQILNTTDENQKQSLSKQIDQAVYQLYDLTDEEIKIIEQA